MKLLVLNWQDATNPRSGGAEIHLHQIFRRLVERGHRVDLLVSRWPGAPERETVDGMRVFRTGGRHSYNLAAPRFYRRHLTNRAYDVVVEDLNKVALFSPFWLRRPLVLLVHHLFGATAFREASFPVAAATWLLEQPVGRAYRGVPVQAVSQSTADDLVSRGLRPGDIRVIHNGVDTGYFAPAEPRAERPLFVYVGRLQRYKRVDVLVRAFARLPPGAELRLAGRGSAADELRALAERLGVSDRVQFLGYVSEDTKRELFRRAWANVFPSPKEGWGISNLEAAACGTPSLASDAPGLRDSVRPGRTGLLFPTGDVEALAALLRRLSGDRSEVERLGTGARRFAERHTWERAADETERHLRAVAAPSASRREAEACPT
ncbi:glycosyltransferase family 4 protein [soil metagenome]